MRKTEQTKAAQAAGVHPEVWSAAVDAGLTVAELKTAKSLRMSALEYVHARQFGVAHAELEEALEICGGSAITYTMFRKEVGTHAEAMAVFNAQVDICGYMMLRRYCVSHSAALKALRAHARKEKKETP